VQGDVVDESVCALPIGDSAITNPRNLLLSEMFFAVADSELVADGLSVSQGECEILSGRSRPARHRVIAVAALVNRASLGVRHEVGRCAVVEQRRGEHLHFFHGEFDYMLVAQVMSRHDRTGFTIKPFPQKHSVHSSSHSQPLPQESQPSQQPFPHERYSSEPMVRPQRQLSQVM